MKLLWAEPALPTGATYIWLSTQSNRLSTNQNQTLQVPYGLCRVASSGDIVEWMKALHIWKCSMQNSLMESEEGEALSWRLICHKTEKSVLDIQ